MARFDSTCNLCGSAKLQLSVERADGIPIMVCEDCGHGVIQYFPDDVNALYGDEYFAAGVDSQYGYSDYEYMAEHGTAWAAALVNLLNPGGGSILDIGCADGSLLRKLGSSFEKSGIEMNARFAEECTRAGIRMIGSDLMNRELHREYAGSFDLVSAIAVFEHIPDLKGSFEAALGFLKPDGVLLFEVPVLSEGNADNAWLHSSYEHIHYPTEKSLHYLFRNILKLELTGATIVIRNFASTYVGLASKSPEVTRAAASSLERWLHSAPQEFAPAELSFRWLLDLIHAGNTDPDLVALSPHVDPGNLNHLIMRRLFELWKAREERSLSVDKHLRDVEDARDWHANESAKKDQIIAAQQAEIAEVRQMVGQASQNANLAVLRMAEAGRRLLSLTQILAVRTHDLVDAKHRIQALEGELAHDQVELERQKVELERQKVELERQKVELERQKVDLERQNVDLERQKMELERKKAELERKNVELEQQKVELERHKVDADLAHQRVRALEASWSWKLTRPLRALGKR